MAYKDLDPQRKLTALAMDIMKHNEFCRLGGLAGVGRQLVKPGVPTAGTDGRDTWWGEAFLQSLTRKQARYVFAHELYHKALRHCMEYKGLWKQNARCANMAADYVVNQLIEDMDPQFQFVERPTSPAPLIDPKYKGWSTVQVFRDLCQQQDKKNGGGKAGDSGDAGAMDEHVMGGEPATPEEKEAHEQLMRDITDAVHQGQRAYEARCQIRGQGAGGMSIEDAAVKRNTNWKDPLRRFITSTCEGHDLARINPPHRVMQAAGFLMHSHFSESVGELGIFCDTSGSMHGYYPIVFGEIARICQHARPKSVRVIWWSDGVEGEQVFEPHQYPHMATLIKPQGCGGTTVSCVARYVREKGYKFQAGVYLSDGYIESEYSVVDCPCLWGIVDNDNFQPSKGQLVRLYSDAI